MNDYITASLHHRALRQKPTHFNLHVAIKVPALKFYAIIIAAFCVKGLKIQTILYLAEAWFERQVRGHSYIT